MALLNINWQALEFERGLTVLGEGLAAATSALEAKHIAIKREWDEYEDAVAGGAATDEVWEDEVKVWDRSHAYDEDIRMVLDTIVIVRKAHVIAAYHLWERVVAAWTKAPPKADHKALVKLVSAKGATIHPRMNAVHALNNALKHNSESAGPALLELWPELFRAGFKKGIADHLAKLAGDPTASKVNWHEAVTITEGHMDEIMEAVRASGPVQTSGTRCLS